MPLTTSTTPVTSVCRAYGQDTGTWDARTTPARREYTAVVDHPALPAALEASGVHICRGAAVELDDRWVFFDGLAPAAAFVRAGRASNLRASLDLYEAAEVRARCAEHDRPEAALLLGRQIFEPAEVCDLVARFAAAAAA
ncbi:hypothetical protein ACFQHV_09080 [Promicromonospora thailandica]|uniref:Uncharacterized protein n=1 Tax=Promicromonospora thailandica TaxID=765201 RepID=A0A9X2G3R1_9MICO|nr:hypothetical protein [Promicromonospora thailandica]MCP2266515.1 hypothetical protein [Promicromonospora thailandica]BFF17418.1 hypothetical protein GCM10025730_09390 [Promicromonospora thailandica]